MLEKRKLKPYKRNYSIWDPLLKRRFWAQQLLKWQAKIVDENWHDMVACPELAEQLGEKWFEKRKQVVEGGAGGGVVEGVEGITVGTR